MNTHPVSNPQTITTLFKTARKNKLIRLGIILLFGLIVSMFIITRQTSVEVDRVIREHYQQLREDDEWGAFLVPLIVSQLTASEKRVGANELLEILYAEDPVVHELPWTHRWSFNRQFRARLFEH